MKIWNILLSLVTWFSFVLSMPSTSEGSDEEPPRESTDLQLFWLDNLTMSLHLPDTTHLTLLLSPASNIPGEPTPCLFSGTVEQDHRSMVAVTGCKESPETDVTIASSLVPNGLVDLVILNGSTYSIKEDTSLKISRQLEVRDDDTMIAPASAHSALHQMAAYSPIPGQVVLETYLRYDNTLLGKFGGSHTSTKQWLSRVVEMARPRLLHSSLDTGLQLQLVGEMTHHNEDIQADGATIRRLARNPKEKGLVSYFGYQLGGGILGIAYLGTACNLGGYAVNINELYSSSNSEVKSARVWVHELGHNIGMRHDFDAAHGGQSGPCNNQGLMSYGNSPDMWSTCSNTDFAAWFLKEGNICLKPTSTGCCQTLQVSGRHFTNGDYARTSQVHNKRPVYKNNNWCIFYGGHWKIEGCAWLARGDNSQGIGWSRVEAACPADIGAQWSYFKWGVGGFSGLNGATAQLPVDPSISVKCKAGSDSWVQLSSYPRGRVELYKNGQWGTLCGHYWWDNQNGAENICKALGYAGGTKYTAPGGSGPILAGNRLCNGGEATVWDCPLKRPETTGCTHDIDQGVSCTGKSKGSDWVQLSSYPRGRVELYKNGQWGTLCGHYWWDNQKGAENICKALGYAGGTKYTAPGGSGPILAGNRLCNGGEATVWDCPLKRPETTDCTHDLDQGVSCT